MKVFNTLSEKKEEFVPVKGRKVIMYVCGLTPYDNAHLGHARTYVAFDVLKRWLLLQGYEVFHIQNITDVDDKLIRRSLETGKNVLEIAEHYHERALCLFDALNIIRANIYPRVSEHIREIVEFIEKLIEKGYAYTTSTGVYFRVKRFKEYGKLSHQKVESLIKGARVEIDKTKESPLDFALWKFYKENEPIWFETKLGKGRPGWHIECSVMSLKYSNYQTIDIHGGARDLIFPHHENEIAQSEAYLEKPFVKYWLHTGFLTINGEKMSKSLGNFVTIEEAIKKFGAKALRTFFVQYHYRSPVDYSEEKVIEARKKYEKIKDAYYILHQLYAKEGQSTWIELWKRFEEAMNDDLNTPVAFSILLETAGKILSCMKSSGIPEKEKAIEVYEKMLFALGLDFEKVDSLELSLMEEILKIRRELRLNKLYELADKIRLDLEKKGYALFDEKDRTYWTKK